MTKYKSHSPRNFKYWKNLVKNKIRWFPYRTKKNIRILLRKLKLMEPYVPKDAYGRPYSLEHVLSCTGKGWENLLRECYAVCVATETDIHQVKEKFGGLRFYVGGSTHKALDKIEEICNRSFEICENCGKPGKLDTDRGWYKTLCDDCTQVERSTTSHELDHLLSPPALKDWRKKIRTGEVRRTILTFINDLEEALKKEK